MSGETPFPERGRLAGIDYGTKRVGVAISDLEQRIASPLCLYERRSRDVDAAWLRRLVSEERIVGFVVGLPVFPSGDESPKSAEARSYAKWIGETTGLPTRLFDERYTTARADELLLGAGLTSQRRKERRDMLAAQILLSDFLESNRMQAPPAALED